MLFPLTQQVTDPQPPSMWSISYQQSNLLKHITHGSSVVVVVVGADVVLVVVVVVGGSDVVVVVVVGSSPQVPLTVSPIE